MHRRIAALGMVASLSLATPVILAPAASAADITTLLERRMADSRLGDDVALLVVDAASGETIADHQGQARQMPASTMKIITAVAALASMKKDHAFATKVLQGSDAAGSPTLVLRGGGDPLLTRTDIADLARTAAQGLRKEHKAAGGSGKPRITVIPDTTLFPDTDRARGWTTSYIPSVASRVESLAFLGDYSRDPSQNVAKYFIDSLRSAGVKASLGTAQTSGNETVVAEKSHPLDAAVRRMLSISDNNVAEVLHRQVAVARGVPADWSGSQEATEALLKDLGIDIADNRIRDGSGLSRKDRVSPRLLVDVLRVARSDPRFSMMFEADALPVAGETGTLAKAYGRYANKPSKCAAGDVHAKTGSLFDVIALSGIAKTKDGGEQAFAILVNDRPQSVSALSTRQAVDGLVATITGCWD